MIEAIGHRGVQAALAAAVLFGLAAPFGKQLVGAIDPFLLAGLLYLGSGLGLGSWRLVAGRPRERLAAGEGRWLAGAIVAGGVVGPALLMLGLKGMAASEAALLLNAEAVFTALVAWVVFRENVDLRVGLGFAAIAAGALLIATGGGLAVGGLWPSLAVLGACLAWGIDNNLTRRVSLLDASWIACVKGLVAGSVNVAIGLGLGAALPGAAGLGGALLLGLFAYGVSLTLFVVALRELGTARAGAYFATAPFFGAVIAVGMGEPLTGALVVAAGLMATGVWLHLSERHEHAHTHAELEHTHWHTHDLHHRHAHPVPVAAGVWHRHPHRHEAITHSHPHYPDAHHRHVH
jgi:drug/metabolite transporter (DMT)-like permease